MISIPERDNHPGLCPRQLWSLWDMLRFKARPFVEATRLIQMLLYGVRDPKLHGFQPEARAAILGQLETLIEQLEELSLPMSRKSAIELRDRLRTAEKPSELQYATDQLSGRITDEIETSYLLCLSASEAALYEPERPFFGEKVKTAFPSLEYEIDEAAKCLALGRSTASAFHAIRCLEAGIRAISRCLGIPDPTRAADRSWFNMLKVVKEAYEKRWPTTAARMSGDGRFFEEMHGLFAAMQNPYRNATMHLDQKYTEDEARHLLEVIKGVMQKIASRVDENGDPKA